MDINTIIESLHPLEQKVLPYIDQCSTLSDLTQKSGLSEVEAMRALQWLENKGALKISTQVKEIIRLEPNGTQYLEQGLPEKRFLQSVKDSPSSLDQISQNAGLSKEELNACIGLLRKKAAINFDQGLVSITDPGRAALDKEWLEESFLRKVQAEPVTVESLSPEERFSYDIFLKRKGIIQPVIEKTKSYELTDLGHELAKAEIKEGETIDRLTPEMLKQGSWKDKKFRRYDVEINVPKITRGKRHFGNQANDYAKSVWIDMGFKEMEGPFVNTCFWNFDALFTAQDHPVREMQDTFYLKNPAIGKLPDDAVVDRVRSMHEHGGDLDSPGWQYKWSEDEAKKIILRTHTTVLSAKTLATLKKEDLPAKFFTLGRNYRNEAMDWSHLFEFNQTDGIVVDPNANFRHLLGYLKRFFAKLGYEKARFRPAYFPYTEPSVEIDVFHPVRKEWLELGGAGIFRPEVVQPLLGEVMPVLAWGPGFDRIQLEYYSINDIRDLYKNDIKQLRTMRQWMR